ncbi:uncharacterized protein G2W53_039586 [Senna tora]|uniref:Uncharacterized protein n=1 Tax=Senna tora TaxID=362788 RepID=A0A834W2Z7_9FABA|nr:uncharacterized protein G2W53_039586 [Senna tora]
MGMNLKSGMGGLEGGWGRGLSFLLRNGFGGGMEGRWFTEAGVTVLGEFGGGDGFGFLGKSEGLGTVEQRGGEKSGEVHGGCLGGVKLWRWRLWGRREAREREG